MTAFNRKWRKDQKMTHRAGLAFWDQTPGAYKGKHREVVLMLCSSSSIETRLKATQRLAEFGFLNDKEFRKEMNLWKKAMSRR